MHTAKCQENALLLSDLHEDALELIAEHMGGLRELIMFGRVSTQLHKLVKRVMHDVDLSRLTVTMSCYDLQTIFRLSSRQIASDFQRNPGRLFVTQRGFRLPYVEAAAQYDTMDVLERLVRVIRERRPSYQPRSRDKVEANNQHPWQAIKERMRPEILLKKRCAELYVPVEERRVRALHSRVDQVVAHINNATFTLFGDKSNTQRVRVTREQVLDWSRRNHLHSYNHGKLWPFYNYFAELITCNQAAQVRFIAPYLVRCMLLQNSARDAMNLLARHQNLAPNESVFAGAIGVIWHMTAISRLYISVLQQHDFDVTFSLDRYVSSLTHIATQAVRQWARWRCSGTTL